jgi:hypothetical protein
MRSLFILLWGAILTSIWWIFAVVIPVPVNDWYMVFKCLWGLFYLANILTLVFIMEVLIKTIHKSWILDK